jgi:PII-like signaling protein
VIAVGSGAQLGLVAPELGGLLRRPLITLEQVRICKRDGQVIGVPLAAVGADAEGRPLWQKLAVYACDSAKHDGHSVHRAIVRRLHAAGIGSTTLRGLWGFHGEQAPHGGHHVPGVTIVVDAPDRIPAAFAIIDELTPARGLVTSEAVTVISRGDQDL